MGESFIMIFSVRHQRCYVLSTTVSPPLMLTCTIIWWQKMSQIITWKTEFTDYPRELFCSSELCHTICWVECNSYLIIYKILTDISGKVQKLNFKLNFTAVLNFKVSGKYQILLTSSSLAQILNFRDFYYTKKLGSVLSVLLFVHQ